MTLTPGQIVERLESIESDAADRQSKGEQAAEAFARAKRDYELAYAKAFVNSTGSPMEKKQRATQALERDPAYYALLEQEGAYEGWKAAMRTLELRTSIGQSLLRAQRERGA
jgi:hypothetical protein